MDLTNKNWAFNLVKEIEEKELRRRRGEERECVCLCGREQKS